MKTLSLMLATLAICATVAQAEPVSPEVMAEYKKLMAEAAELRADQSQTWMNERRAAEIKTLVREVLADAETRASLMDSAITAGHNGRNFFLASEDGSFLMKIDGQIQFRYIVNFADDDDSGTTSNFDEGEAGFVVARTKLQFSGHIADPKLHYAIRLAVDREDNAVSADRITVGYDLTDDLYLWFGEDTAPFMREEMVDSSRQLAVERSLMNEIFSLDKVQGVGVIWDPTDNLKVQAMIHDGAHSGNGSATLRFEELNDYIDPNIDADDPTSKDFDDDAVDFAVVARVDWLIMGNWNQWDDFTTFAGEDEFAYIGGAINYEAGETGASGAAASVSDDVTLWTVDAGYENNGWSFFAAYSGVDIDRDASGVADGDPWGVLVQGAYNIELDNGDSIEPFARWELIDFDDIAESDVGDLEFITIGMNWYHKKHAAKFTLDFVIVTNNIEDENELLGLVETDDGTPIEDNNQYVIRAQYQLLF